MAGCNKCIHSFSAYTIRKIENLCLNIFKVYKDIVIPTVQVAEVLNNTNCKCQVMAQTKITGDYFIWTSGSTHNSVSALLSALHSCRMSSASSTCVRVTFCNKYRP